jgi:hypothetical protein
MLKNIVIKRMYERKQRKEEISSKMTGKLKYR